MNEIIVKAVESAITSDATSASPNGAVGIRYPAEFGDLPLFILTRSQIHCTRCGRSLVPQFPNGMKRWTKAKEGWIRRHAACAFR